MGAGSVVENSHPLLQGDALSQTLADIGSNGAPAALVQVIRWLDSFHFDEVPFPELARLVAALDEAEFLGACVRCDTTHQKPCGPRARSNATMCRCWPPTGGTPCMARR